MELINKKQLKEEIEKQVALKFLHPQEQYYLILKTINELPAVDGDAYKRGRWLDNPQGRWIYKRCSLCGKLSDTATPYCAYCGAEMEVAENDRT